MTFDTNEFPAVTIFVVDTGYTMIIPEFYRFVQPKGTCSIILEKMNTDASGTRGHCVPTTGNGNLFVSRINKCGQLKIDNHIAKVWDGTPEYYDFMD